MQVAQPQFHQLAQGNIIPISWGNRMSLNKEWDDSIEFGQWESSEWDGTDLWSPATDDPLNFWDYYKYSDYTQRLLGMEWSRSIDFPHSVSSAQADFKFSNTDDFFSGSNLLPKRPVRLLAGYNGENLQQFVGITDDKPSFDDKEKTVTLHANDFLVEIFSLSLTGIIAMQDARTDEVLAAIFSQFNISPSSYVLAKGRNKIPFVFFDVDKNAGNAIREIMQAEGGHLWIDENGIIRFETRLPDVDSPVMILDDSNIVTLNKSGTANIINQIKIISEVRTVRPFQKVKSNADDGSDVLDVSTMFKIEANSSAPYYMDLDDPCLDVSDPTIGQKSDDSWFTAINSAGAVVGSVDVTGTALHTNQHVTFLENNNNFDVYIDRMELWGRPAKVKNMIKFLAKDQDSIDKYELQALGGDEGITNNFFGSWSNCESFAQTIIDAYGEFSPTIEAEIIGDFSLQLGDIVQLQSGGDDDQYRITDISPNIYPFEFKIKARRYNPRLWAKWDVTEWDSLTDVAAP